MPLHDYRCNACQRESEPLMRGSTAPACPHCGSTDLQRLVSLPAPPGTGQATIAAGRRAAAREGHFSNYSRAERTKLSR